MPGTIHFSFDIDGDRELSAKLHGLLHALTDWRPAFEAIAADWRATMAAKFETAGQHEAGTDDQGNPLPGWAPLFERVIGDGLNPVRLLPALRRRRPQPLSVSGLSRGNTRGHPQRRP